MNMWGKGKWKRSLLGTCMLILVFFACSNPQAPEGETDILDKDKMAEMLTDLQLVESVIRISAAEQETNVDSIDYNTAVFERHNISREQFERSMEYYTQHPDQLEEIYDQVIVKLSEKQAGYQGVEAK
jgi:hypothetical protein